MPESPVTSSYVTCTPFLKGIEVDTFLRALKAGERIAVYMVVAHIDLSGLLKASPPSLDEFSRHFVDNLKPGG